MLNRDLFILGYILFAGLLCGQNMVSTKSIVSPPQASRLGNASIALPFDLPDDVTSFKPDLNLYYNSDGGSSWVGYGFSLGASSIVVDNRWGVPLFNTDEETELYSLDGMQLMYPNNYLPHRHSGDNPDNFDTSHQLREEYNTTVDNLPAKVFQPRKKTNFSKIERFGDSPVNYYWKVTHTNGTVQWFGGTQRGLNTNYVLQDSDGNIIEWALVRTVDRHGNYIGYTYDKGVYTNAHVEDRYADANLVGSTYFYLKTIVYTGLLDESGNVLRPPKMRLFFSYHRFPRKDVVIDAKSGVFRVDNKRIGRINIYQKRGGIYKSVKQYRFYYKTGAFSKTLLSRVDETFGNSIIFTNKFDYYELDGSIYNTSFTIDEKSSQEYADVDVSMPLNIDQLTSNTVLNRSKSTEWGWEIRGGLGLQIRPLILPPTGSSNRTFTAGATYGQSYSNNIELMGLLDINGDGLKDIVFKDDNGINYKPRINRSGNNLFGNVIHLDTIRNIGVTKGRNITLFPNSVDFRSKWLNWGKKSFKNTSESTVYITDANADMLMDIVDLDSNGNSIVYFNSLEDGIPTFTPDSSVTPNMLITASPASEVIIDDPFDDEVILDPPNIINHDAVKVWTSFIKKTGYNPDIPNSEFDVPIISDSLMFYPSTPTSKLTYSIEFYDKSENTITQIFHHTFDNTDSTTLRVKVYEPHDFDFGDKVFFRVHKNRDGINDILKTNPTIFYDKKMTGISMTNFIEAEGEKGTSYAKDLLLSKQEGFPITESSSISIDWDNIEIPEGSQPGDVIFSVKLITVNSSDQETTTENLFTHTLSENGMNVSPTSNLSNISVNIDEDEIALLLFEVNSNKFIAMENNSFDGMPVWKPVIEDTNTGLRSYPIPYYNNYTPIKLDFNIFNLFIHYHYISPEGSIDGVELNFATTASNIGDSLNELKGKFRIVSGDDERQIVFDNGNILMLDMDDQVANDPLIIEDVSDISYYADNITETELLNNVRDNLCFNVKYKISDIWYDNPNYSSCNPFSFKAFGKQSANLGSNQMGWGQFFYNDEFDENSPVTSEGYKLINIDIINDPSMGESDSFGINENDYNEGSTVEDIENDIEDGLNIPENETDEGYDNYINQQAQGVSFDFPFLPASPIRYLTNLENVERETPRWQGLFDSQYLEPFFTQAGSLEQTSISQITNQENSTTVYQAANLQTGMFGVKKETITKTKSNKTGLFSISRSNSESRYSHLKSDFIDLNGDSYPDRVLGNTIQYTTMTGGHSDLVTDYNLPTYITNSKNKISGTTGSYSTSYHNALNEFRTDVSNVSNFIKGGSDRYYSSVSNYVSSIFNNAEGKKSPFALSGNLSLSINDPSSYNETTLFNQDINSDGLLDIYSKDDPDKIRLKSGYNNELIAFNGISTMNSAPSLLNFGLGGGISDYGISAFEANQTLQQALSGLELGNGDYGIVNGVAPSAIGFNLALQLGIGGSGSKVITTYQDLNGDGLQDLILVGEEDGMVMYNLGNKFDAPVPIGSDDLNINLRAMSRTISGTMGVDADLYYGIPIFTFWVVIVGVPVPIFTLYFKTGLSGALVGSISMNDTRKSFMDFDGDGFVDYLRKDGEQIRIYPSQIKMGNKLKSVSNTLGKQFEIDYKLIGNTYDMPMGKWVMSDIYYFNGKTGNSNFSTDDAVHDVIEYNGGYYDRRERQFYGYEKIATKRVSGDNTLWTTLNKFHNRSYYLNGLLKEQATFNDDYAIEEFTGCNNIMATSNLFSCKSNHYQLKGIVNGVINEEQNLDDDYDTGGTEGRGVAGVTLTSSVENLYQFQAEPIVSTTVYQMDEYARTIRSELVEEGNISRYYYPDENNQTALFNQYAISSPYKTESLKSVNGNEELLTSTEILFESNADTNNFLVPTIIKSSKGNNDFVEESTIDLYDNNGRPRQTTDRYGVPTTLIYGYDEKLPILSVKGLTYGDLSALIDITALQSDADADLDASTEDTFRTSLLNAISAINASNNDIQEIKAFTYDLNIGVTSEINMNGFITFYTYDALNRLVQISQKDSNNDGNADIIKTFEYETVGVTP